MKFLSRKKYLNILSVALIVLGVFMLGPLAKADNWADTVISGLLSIFVWALGGILSLIIKGLLAVAEYQVFIKVPVVEKGWVVVRDFCNMFFVVVLMIISFGTILHLENYNYKKWLPKLILMAVLINFSKTICGLLIDVSQVVMLTFVNAFKDIGAGNATEMLGIADIVKSKDGQAEVASAFASSGAYALGIVYLLVAIVVFATMAMMLVMRLVMIWIYVVLSPLAYLMSAFPGGQKFASQWWDEFTKNLIVGPVLAFFIWLSLATLQAGSNIPSAADDNFFGTQGSSTASLVKFIVAIGMLVGGLTTAQQIGGAAGGVAGKGMAKLQKGAAFAGGLATGAGMLSLKGAKSGVSYLNDKLQNKTGVDLNLARVWAGVSAKRKEIREKRYAEGQDLAGRKMAEGGRIMGALAMTGNPGDAWEQVTSLEGIGKRLKGGKYMAKQLAIHKEEKESAETNLGNAKFQEDFMSLDPAKRQESLDDMTAEHMYATEERQAAEERKAGINQEIKKEANKGAYRDQSKINELEKQRLVAEEAIAAVDKKRNQLNSRLVFASNNKNKVFSNKEQYEAREKTKSAHRSVEETKEKIEKNIPEYNFEARAAEKHAVQEEASKIKDITDPSELLRILKGAISAHDKTLVKAITLKMTKDANDNEYLKPLAGRTDHIGLKNLMKQLSTKGSEHYAGFSEQEAFGLGSEIAEINKGTNHWAATSAYKMENGNWHETTDEEHNHIRDIETGKQQLQGFIRMNNRLAYGYHDVKGDFHLDAGGVLKIKAIDTESGHKNIDTMNESAAKHIYDAIVKDKNSELYNHFNTSQFKVKGKEKDKDGNIVDVDGETFLEALGRRLGNIRDNAEFSSTLASAKSLLT